MRQVEEKKKAKNKENKMVELKKENKSNKTTKKEDSKMKKFFKKVGTVLRKKWLINGYKTLLLVAIIIVFYAGVNLLLEKVVLPEIDCTSQKIYSISEETRDKIGNMDKQVTITLINYSEDTSLVGLVEKYISLNNNIKLEKVDDLSAKSELMTKYSLEATDSLIVISSGENEKTIDSSDLYTYDYSTYKQIDTTEEAITNAILDVTTNEKSKIYFSKTHLFYDIQYYNSIMEAMKKEANEVETVDILANGKVPDDCNCLVLTTLKEDFSEQERDSILEYIKNGGNLLLLCGPNITNINLNNFQKILDEYGINIANGVILEGKDSNMMAGYPDFIIEETQSSSLTEKLNMGTSICLVDAGKIEFKDEDTLEKLDVEYETVATTSEDAFLRTDVNQQSVSKIPSDSENEESTVAAVVTKGVESNNQTSSEEVDEEEENGPRSKLVIFSNELFAMDMPVQLNGYTMYTLNLYNNKDLILNSVAYLTERENTITIRKNVDDVTYTVTEAQNNIILAIIFITPVLIIVAGIVVWQVRRRKK